EPSADATERALAEQAPDREPADRKDQPRGHETQLPLTPERAQLLLARRRRSIATAQDRTSGVAAGDRSAVERRVEGGLVHGEPAAQRLARSPSPRAPLDAFDGARRLAEDEGALPSVALEDGHRLEPEACFRAGAAAAVVPLQRRERAVRRPTPGHCGEGAPTRRAFPSGSVR